MEKDEIFNAEENLRTSQVEYSAQSRAKLNVRSNFKLDQTAQDLVYLSYAYLQGRNIPSSLRPSAVPIVKIVSWYFPGICKHCYLCPLPRILSVCVFEENSLSIFMIRLRCWKQQ